jgi:hypothetical protein
LASATWRRSICDAGQNADLALDGQAELVRLADRVAVLLALVREHLAELDDVAVDREHADLDAILFLDGEVALVVDELGLGDHALGLRAHVEQHGVVREADDARLDHTAGDQARRLGALTTTLLRARRGGLLRLLLVACLLLGELEHLREGHLVLGERRRGAGPLAGLNGVLSGLVRGLGRGRLRRLLRVVGHRHDLFSHRREGLWGAGEKGSRRLLLRARVVTRDLGAAERRGLYKGLR